MTTSSNISSLPDGAPTLRVMPMPTDANIHGDVFGGWIMSQVDIAGAIPATRRAQGRVATISVNAFTFKQPVFVGDLLSFYTEIIKTGRTSITVSVEVYAERKRLQLETVKVTEATLTYVATDDERRSRPLPPGRLGSLVLPRRLELAGVRRAHLGPEPVPRRGGGDRSDAPACLCAEPGPEGAAAPGGAGREG